MLGVRHRQLMCSVWLCAYYIVTLFVTQVCKPVCQKVTTVTTTTTLQSSTGVTSFGKGGGFLGKKH